MRRTAWLAVVLAVLVALPAVAAPRRMALVVGNGAYTHAPALPNPPNDARGVAAVLRGLGFEVLLGLDLDHRRMRDLLHRFARAVDQADVGLFFYAGHGLQVDGANYLVPIDARLESRADLRFETIGLDVILDPLESGRDRTNLVFLDACRDNPLARSLARSLGARSTAIGRGLAPVRSGLGTLIAYATDPGDVALDGDGRNSPFSAALIEHLATPGLEVRSMLSRVRLDVVEATGGRQRPWTQESLLGDFYLVPEQEEGPPPDREPTPAPAPGGRQAETAFWDTIKQETDPAYFEEYLRLVEEGQFVGIFAGLARLRLKALKRHSAAGPFETAAEAALDAKGPAVAALTPEPTPEPPPAPTVVGPEAIEAELRLTRAQWRQVQRALAALGHDPGYPDGVAGPRTRAALRAWQRARGEGATGYLSPGQHEALVAAASEVDVAVGVFPGADVSTSGRLRPEPFSSFHDCAGCPEMAVLPGGTFLMGSPVYEAGRDDDEGPWHEVRVAPFALGKYEVTFEQWHACVDAGGCSHRPSDMGWGRDRRPVINVTWDDAQEYVAWLDEVTGEDFRLPTEAEWEYAARAGTTTPFWTGGTISTAQANYDGNYTYGSGQRGEYRQQTTPVDAFAANPWGLHDIHGNVWEWVQDCYHDGYTGARTDGSARDEEGCTARVVRGGSWNDLPGDLRSANRNWNRPDARFYKVGFRVARALAP